MSEPVLHVEDLSVGFPTRSGAPAIAADEVTFQVHAGRTLGLVGESGCGKSMTLRALMGLVPYPGQVLGGSVRLDGDELLTLGPRAWESVRGSRIAMVFQDPMTSLNPLFSIGDQLTEVLRLKRGLGREAARAEAVELLDHVGIRGAADRLWEYPHQLSGGMRQRVMIALAIAARPRLLLADEPTTALDVTVQDQILALLSSLRDELHMATILVSHDLGVIGQACDDVVVMYAGRVVERGPVDDVLDHPRHPYTEGLTQAVAQLGEARGRDSRALESLGGQPPALTELPPGCPFAPRCRYREPQCERSDVHLDAPYPEHATACLVRQSEGVR
jgi:oligopeptide/dipeptide ABC transporter ATP-binding protein